MSTPVQGGLPVYPDVPSLSRPALISAVLGALGLGAALYFDRWLIGALFCVGLLLGLLNIALAHRDVAKVTAQDNPNKRQLAVASLSRLMVITAIALVIGFVLRPDGVGIFVGLAVFQVILVVNTTVPVMRGLRQHD